MHWYDLSENPPAVRSLYPGAPELAEIELFEVSFGRDGPSVKLRFDVERYPEKPPAKWKGFNRAQLVVDFFDVGDCRLDGWGTPNRCRLAIERAGDRFRVEARGAEGSVTFTTGVFRIANVTGYHDTRLG